MRYRTTVLLIAALVIVACKPTVPAVETTGTAPAATSAEAAPPPSPPTQMPAAASSIDAAFVKGMAYADLRKRLIDAGWLPLRDPMCAQNMGGDGLACRALPEVESCSSDGYCNMRFADATEGKRIAIGTYGPYERWNTPGEEASLAVQSWEIVDVVPSMSAAAPACPAQDFDGFIRAFASDARTRLAFTAPLVEVAELGGGEDGDDPVLVYEQGGDYDQFILQYRDGRWYTAPIEDVAPSTPIEVATRAEAAGAYYVFIPGSVEGISYRFERRGDCWQLTSDPDVVP